MNKDLRTLAREYQRRGWEITPTGSGHWLWCSPIGARVITSATPSCRFALHKIIGDLRRAERLQQRRDQ
jgi:hypothetical protein